MLNYLRIILAVALTAARLLGRFRLIKVLCFAIAARLSLLICFVSVIQVSVLVVKADGTQPLPLIGTLPLDLQSILTLACLAVPIVFTLSGWSMLYSLKLSTAYIATFTFEARKRLIETEAPELKGESDKDRRAEVTTFSAQTEPEFGRAAKAMIGGVLGLMQSVIIGLAVSTLMLVINWVVLVLVAVASALFLPRYVRNSYVGHLNEKKAVQAISAARRQERIDVSASKSVVDGDPEVLRNELVGMLYGEASLADAELNLKRQIGPRKPFPFLYGSLGLILGYLLYSTVASEPEVRASALAHFVIIAMLLRFLVGEIGSVLNALRQFNAGYPHAQKLCELLKQ